MPNHKKDTIKYGPIGLFSKEKPLTSELLKIYLTYHPSTGVFTWNERIGMRRPIDSEAGWTHPRGYKYIDIASSAYFTHRLAFLYMLDKVPEQVDHIDRDKGNNSWVNLRPANNSLNQRNVRIRCTNKSGYSGVSFNKRKKKWIARIKLRGDDIYLGEFNSAEEAGQIVEKTKLELI